LAVGLVAWLLSVGCGGSGDDAGGPADDGPAASTEDGPRGETADIVPLSVELLDAGSGPRSVLAEDVGAIRGSSAPFRMDLTVTGITSARVEGMSRIGAPVELEDGAAAVAYGLGGLDVTLDVAGSPRTVAQDALAMNWQLAVGPGRRVLAGTVRTLTSGNLPGVETVASSLDPRLTSLLLPFPTEPVGIGAQWDVEGPLPMFGATVSLAGRLELVERRGARFVISAALDISTPRPGTTADITLEGFGRLAGDLHQLGLREGSLSMSGTFARADRGGVAITSPMSVGISIGPPEDV
jgi:hypothetical protein